MFSIHLIFWWKFCSNHSACAGNVVFKPKGTTPSLQVWKGHQGGTMNIHDTPCQMLKYGKLCMPNINSVITFQQNQYVWRCHRQTLFFFSEKIWTLSMIDKSSKLHSSEPYNRIGFIFASIILHRTVNDILFKLLDNLVIFDQKLILLLKILVST